MVVVVVMRETMADVGVMGAAVQGQSGGTRVILMSRFGHRGGTDGRGAAVCGGWTRWIEI